MSCLISILGIVLVLFLQTQAALAGQVTIHNRNCATLLTNFVKVHIYAPNETCRDPDAPVQSNECDSDYPACTVGYYKIEKGKSETITLAEYGVIGREVCVYAHEAEGTIAGKIDIKGNEDSSVICRTDPTGVLCWCSKYIDTAYQTETVPSGAEASFQGQEYHGGGGEGTKILESNNYQLFWRSDGGYLQLLGPDSNSVINKEIWTNGNSNMVNLKNWAALQGDGNLVVYGPNGPLWASGTANDEQGGKGGRKLILNANGNLVITDVDSKIIWQSNSGQ